MFKRVTISFSIFSTENEVVPKVLEAILNMPAITHIAVKYTSILLLGELSEWIEKHPQVLDPVLNFLVQSLAVQGLGRVNLQLNKLNVKFTGT